jgi:hypothetical protein
VCGSRDCDATRPDRGCSCVLLVRTIPCLRGRARTESTPSPASSLSSIKALRRINYLTYEYQKWSVPFDNVRARCIAGCRLAARYDGCRYFTLNYFVESLAPHHSHTPFDFPPSLSLPLSFHTTSRTLPESSSYLSILACLGLSFPSPPFSSHPPHSLTLLTAFEPAHPYETPRFLALPPFHLRIISARRRSRQRFRLCLCPLRRIRSASKRRETHCTTSF